ncbi:TPA: type I toxin-antitoxin system ptaRNA1 family toxin [Proteus mirabilis]
MATINTNDISKVIQHAAAELSAIDWMDQKTARAVGPLAEATVNLFMVLYYQAETGLATRDDFTQGRATLQRALNQQQSH